MRKKGLLILFVTAIMSLLMFSFVACDKAKDTVENLLAKAPVNVQYDGQYLT